MATNWKRITEKIPTHLLSTKDLKEIVDEIQATLKDEWRDGYNAGYKQGRRMRRGRD